MSNQEKFDRSQLAITDERARLEGAQAALNELREYLTVRLGEARDEAAREIYDEMLTLIDARLIEYARRETEPTVPLVRHASFVFLLDAEGGVHPIPHHLYVELVRGAAANPHLAGKSMRLAEWYVRMTHGTPETVVNETYALLTFDAEGRVDWAATPSFHPHRDDAVLASESASLPTPEERDRMLAVLFGTV